jgi:hypothetical protein
MSGFSAAALRAIAANGHCAAWLQAWKAASPRLSRQPVSATSTMRCTSACGASSVKPPTSTRRAPAGQGASQVATSKRVACSAAWALDARRSTLAGGARKSMTVWPESQRNNGQVAEPSAGETAATARTTQPRLAACCTQACCTGGSAGGGVCAQPARSTAPPAAACSSPPCQRRTAAERIVPLSTRPWPKAACCAVPGGCTARTCRCR